MDIEEIKTWFEKWGELKVVIHVTDRLFYFREREIWWTSLGANIGFEQNGKNDAFERPVVIIKKFNKNMLWILPLTSRGKTGEYYFDLASAGFNSRVILSQLRLISSKRLIRKIGLVPPKIFISLTNRLKNLLN